jgi:drug/metabolite transporter (DMT)-like permease
MSQSPSNTSHRNTLGASGALLFATVIFGATFPISKFILANMDALSMTLLRYGVAAPLFLLLLAWREGLAALRPDGRAWRLFALGSLGFAGFNLFMFYGVTLSRPEFGAIVMALQPLIAVLIGWARSGKRPALSSFLALALALSGVVLLTTDGHIARLTEHAAVLPILMMISGGACWVLYSMGIAGFPGWSPLRYTALSSSGGAVFLILAWILASRFGVLRLPEAVAWPALAPALLFVVLVGAVLAVLSWNMGIRAMGAQNGMLFINVVPLTALGLGVLRGQHFGGWELFGATLVLLSLLCNQLASRIAEQLSQRQRTRLAMAASCQG